MQPINLREIEGSIEGFKFAGGKIGTILFLAIQYIFIIAGVALLFYLIYGGFQLMTSGGDPGKMKEARAILTNAVVGFLIIFVAYWLVQVVGVAFGIKEIQEIFQFGGGGGPSGGGGAED